MKAITPFLIIAVCIGMYFVYMKPQLESINQKREKYAEYKNVLSRVQEISAIRDSLTQTYENISQDHKDKLDILIPAKFDSVLFANDLNGMAEKYNLEIDRITTDYKNIPGLTQDNAAENPEIVFKTITSQFHLTGTYDEFIAFLQELESSLRLLDVISLLVRPITTERGLISNDLDYTVTIKTYSLK